MAPKIKEDISTYKFDFVTEVNALRRLLGPKADEIFFVEVSVDQRAAEPATILRTVGNTPLAQQVCDRIKQAYKDAPGFSSFFSREEKYGIRTGFVAFRENEQAMGMFGENHKDMLRLFFLYHETAHGLIVAGPRTDDDHPFLECAADAYAALRLLQRFGQDAVPLLSLISWSRASLALTTGTTHLSTFALDRIIAENASRNFSRLSHAEIIEKAATYATESTPAPGMLAEARNTLRQNWFYATSADKAHLAIETCLNSPSELARYIGAKFCEPFLQENLIHFRGRNMRYAAQTQKNYAALIKNCATAANMPEVAKLLGPEAAPSRLHQMFNPRAKKSLRKFLRVSNPAGQYGFIFRG
jgi:hypothetical protein